MKFLIKRLKLKDVDGEVLSDDDGLLTENYNTEMTHTNII